jgi:hypothetical protein
MLFQFLHRQFGTNKKMYYTVLFVGGLVAGLLTHLLLNW